MQLKQLDGLVVEKAVPAQYASLLLNERSLVGVSDNVAQLSNLAIVWLNNNALLEIPDGILRVRRLTLLHLAGNRLVAISPQIKWLTLLTNLYLQHNRLVCVPRELGQLVALEFLSLNDNLLEALPSSIGSLRSLRSLSLQNNRLAWLPLSLARLERASVALSGNERLPAGESVRDVVEASSSHIMAAMRDDAATIAIGLQELELPALVTLEIVDAALPNLVPMHKKWDLIVAVRHFHQRVT